MPSLRATRTQTACFSRNYEFDLTIPFFSLCCQPSIHLDIFYFILFYLMETNFSLTFFERKRGENEEEKKEEKNCIAFIGHYFLVVDWTGYLFSIFFILFIIFIFYFLLQTATWKICLLLHYQISFFMLLYVYLYLLYYTGLFRIIDKRDFKKIT